MLSIKIYAFIGQIILYSLLPPNDGTLFTITVHINNISSDEGQIICNLHNEAKTFPKKHIVRKTSKIVKNSSKIVFRNIKKGEYAISVLHDVNMNGKIDFNIFHIPSEDTGVSNNAKGFIGPPKFEDAKFYIDRDSTIFITL